MKKKPVYTIEYCVIGDNTEEWFETLSDGKNFLANLPQDEQLNCQFFSKEYTNGEEGQVEIFKRKGEKYNPEIQ